LINSQRERERERQRDGIRLRGLVMLWMSKFEGLKNGKGILGLLKGHVWWVLFSMENTFTFMFTIIITIHHHHCCYYKYISKFSSSILFYRAQMG
jgi:hypothetical protein